MKRSEINLLISYFHRDQDHQVNPADPKFMMDIDLLCQDGESVVKGEQVLRILARRKKVMSVFSVYVQLLRLTEATRNLYILAKKLDCQDPRKCSGIC